jgi:hypothetical protein
MVTMDFMGYRKELKHMIFPIIRVHPSTSEHTHYTEVLHAVQWDEITLSEWQSYPDCLAEINQREATASPRRSKDREYH